MECVHATSDVDVLLAGHIYASVSSPNSPPEVVFRYNEFHGWVQLITERHERIEKDIVQTLLFPLKISTKQVCLNNPESHVAENFPPSLTQLVFKQSLISSAQSETRRILCISMC